MWHPGLQGAASWQEDVRTVIKHMHPIRSEGTAESTERSRADRPTGVPAPLTHTGGTAPRRHAGELPDSQAWLDALPPQSWFRVRGRR